MTGDKQNKNLGQHWLRDVCILTNIAAYAKIQDDTVLEIGPGPGFLTSILLKNAKRVVAVEFDHELANRLAGFLADSEAAKATARFPGDIPSRTTPSSPSSRVSVIDAGAVTPEPAREEQSPALADSTRRETLCSEDLSPSDAKTYIPDDADRFVQPQFKELELDGSAGRPAYDVFASDGSEEKVVSRRESIAKLEVINADFLQFDLGQLSVGYKVVANIPYYITGKIIMKLLTAENKPSVAVVLVQKEVAERLAAGPGEMSILSVAAQLYADIELGLVVPAAKFDPPPKVDSQVVIFHPHPISSVLAGSVSEEQLFRVVKAGFSQRRKKLRTALAGGLNLAKSDVEKILGQADIDPNLRAQDLTLDDWYNLAKQSKMFI